MKCLLAATRDLLSCTDDPCHPFIAFTSRSSPQNFTINKWASTIFEETSHWRYEEPKPTTGTRSIHDGQSRDYVSRPNSHFRYFLWQFWFEDTPKHTTTLPESSGNNYNPEFPDYLGLCIWDFKRLGYLGLAEMFHAYLDRGPIRNPSNYGAYTSTRAPIRWQDVFMLEVVRLPGKQRHQMSRDLDNHIQKWKRIPQSLKVNLDTYRLEFPWEACVRWDAEHCNK